jgi:hypothetical protein
MSSQTDFFVYLPILLMAGFVIIMLIVSYFTLVGRGRAWADLAERTGLMYEPGQFFGYGRSVSGVYQRHQIKLDSFTRGTGKSSHTYTRIVALLNQPTNLSLTIYQEGMFSKLGKALGMKELSIGDDEIDRRFVIQGQPESDVIRALTSLGMRQRLIEAPGLHLEVKGQEIRYEKRGFETDPNTLIAVFDLMCALGDAIDHLQS